MICIDSAMKFKFCFIEVIPTEKIRFLILCFLMLFSTFTAYNLNTEVQKRLNSICSGKRLPCSQLNSIFDFVKITHSFLKITLFSMIRCKNIIPIIIRHFTLYRQLITTIN